MIQIKDSSMYKSLKSEGAVFGKQAEQMLGKKGTMGNEFVPLELDDVIVMPLNPEYGYTKQFGGFILVHLLKGGDVNDASVYRLYPGTIDRTIFPVEQDDEGIYQPMDINPRPRNDGDVVSFVKGFGSWKDAFKGMAGKAFKIENVDNYEVFRFGSKTETQPRNRYTLTFVAVDDKIKPFTEPSAPAKKS